MRKSIILGLALIVVLAFTSACAPNTIEQLEGVLQNVDAANGEITIVTKDGQTITLKIDTEASVETEGASSTLETLEIGVPIQIEINEDNQVVQRIKAHQTEVDGVIIQIDGDEVTIESEDGQRVTILVSENTRIESEDDLPGTSAALHVGAEVETKFDPESGVAYMISEQEEAGEVGGSDQNTLTSPTEPPEDVIITDPPDDNILTITNGIIQKIEGDIWTIIDQNGVIWIVDVTDLVLNVDAVVGSTVSLYAIIYDEGIVAEEAEVYLHEEGDDEGEHPDDGEGEHPDDGEGEHPDDGEGDYPDDGEGDHTD